MATKKKALTKKQLRLLRYNDIIVKNKKLFKAGQYLTRDAFIRLFNIQGVVSSGTYEEMHRSNLKLVTAQTEINMLMRENGLYIASEDYYQFFNVVNKDRVKAEVVRYSAGIDINNACTGRLEAKLKTRTQANTWGVYNKVPRSEIERMGNYKETVRHTRVKKRVSQI